jgi:hypothetical protein
LHLPSNFKNYFSPEKKKEESLNSKGPETSHLKEFRTDNLAPIHKTPKEVRLDGKIHPATFSTIPIDPRFHKSEKKRCPIISQKSASKREKVNPFSIVKSFPPSHPLDQGKFI